MKRDRDKLFEKTSPEVRALRKQATRELRQEKRRQFMADRMEKVRQQPPPTEAEVDTQFKASAEFRKRNI